MDLGAAKGQGVFFLRAAPTGKRNTPSEVAAERAPTLPLVLSCVYLLLLPMMFGLKGVVRGREVVRPR